MKAYIGIAAMMAVFLSSCLDQDYRDFTTASGRQAVIDRANAYLTIGQCDDAINTLRPLYESQYVDNDIRIIFASAAACKGGMNFPAIFNALSNGMSNLWKSIVKANYSASFNDGHITNLELASDIMQLTSTDPTSLEALYRPANANVYMIFVWSEILGSLISVLGAADPATGARRQNFPALTDPQKCLAEVAVANIVDCSNRVAAGTGPLSALQAQVNSICGMVAGGCPTNKDLNHCQQTPDLDAGLVILTTIQTQW